MDEVWIVFWDFGLDETRADEPMGLFADEHSADQAIEMLQQVSEGERFWKEKWPLDTIMTSNWGLGRESD